MIQTFILNSRGFQHLCIALKVENTSRKLFFRDVDVVGIPVAEVMGHIDPERPETMAGRLNQVISLAHHLGNAVEIAPFARSSIFGASIYQLLMILLGDALFINTF